jgi:hypothetical protein
VASMARFIRSTSKHCVVDIAIDSRITYSN